MKIDVRLLDSCGAIVIAIFVFYFFFFLLLFSY